MDANLLLFKTVIAGDSWGEVAVPVIQAGESNGLNPKIHTIGWFHVPRSINYKE